MHRLCHLTESRSGLDPRQGGAQRADGHQCGIESNALSPYALADGLRLFIVIG